MINLKDIKSAKYISDPTEEKLNDLKLVSQETDKEIVSTQGENTKDILRARSTERLDALNAGSVEFDNKIGERETSVAEELTEITDRTETVISDSEKYTEDIEAFLSVAKGDDFLFFLDDCTRAVGRLNKLTNGSGLCRSKKITSWDIPLSTLTNGRGMFQSCINLTNFQSDLSALTDGQDMFMGCAKLTSFSVDLHALKYGRGMFYNCINLTNFQSDLSSYIGVTGGDQYWSGMFQNCPFTSWDIPLPSLKSGFSMFIFCKKLASFNVDLPAMTYGEAMFWGCESLTRFSSALPKMTYGRGIFYGCKSLISFSSAIPALTSGDEMFSLCKLDLASVQAIAATINDLAIQNKSGNITIGMQKTLKYDSTLTDEEQPDAVAAREALSIISSKGWTIVEQYNS